MASEQRLGRNQEKAKATPGKRALLVMGVERRVREEEALREVRGPDL